MADFTMFAGDSKTLVVTVVDQDGVAVNLATAKIYWKAARSVNATALIEKSSDPVDGISITDAAGGIFEVAIDPTDTEDLRGVFYHEAEVDDGDYVDTALWGTMTITPALIKPVGP